MRIFFILILFITFKVHAATFLFGHENIKLGMDKDKALKLIKEKNSHEFLTAQIIEDSTIYLIGGLEFNREITFLYEKVKEIQLHTMVEYKNISSIEDDLDKIMYLFDEKANFLGAQNNKNEVIIIEGSEKTYRQKQIYEDELGVEYKSSEKFILNNEFKDVTRKYEFENSNIECVNLTAYL